MADLQTQIDELRARLITLQGSLAARALKSEMHTINDELSVDIDTLVAKYDALLDCVKELQNELLAARQELIDAQS
jgi:hypothetical protein